MICPEDDGLYQEMQDQIKFAWRKRERYTLWKNVTRMVLLILSAAITLISGWDATHQDKISVFLMSTEMSEGHVILIMSTMITFITAVEALFKYSDKSNTYHLMHFEFKTLQRKMCYDYEKDAAFFKTQKDEYFKQYQDILSSQKDLIEKQS